MTPAPAARPWYVTCLSLIGVGTLAIVLVVAGLLWFGRGAAPTPPSRAAVTYRVTGTAEQAAITYANSDGGTEQRTVDVPWESSHRADRGEFVAISAQNQAGGTITCAIVIDGATFKSSTSEGEYKIASCSGAVP